MKSYPYRKTPLLVGMIQHLLLILSLSVPIVQAQNHTTTAYHDDHDHPILIWSSSGGGWRSMVAAMGYANAFSQLGILGQTTTTITTTNTSIWNTNPNITSITTGRTSSTVIPIRSVSTTSGATWFSTQFFYSNEFYNVVANGTPDQLYNFITGWMDSYLKYQWDLIVPEVACPIPSDEPRFALLCYILKEIDSSWSGFLTGMLQKASQQYNDKRFVYREVNAQNRVTALQQTELYIQTSLSPTSRILRPIGNDFITYVGPNNNPNEQVYSTPLGVHYQVYNDGTNRYKYSVPDQELPLQTYTGRPASRRLTLPDDWEEYYLYPGTNGQILTNKPNNAIRTGTLSEPYQGTAPSVGQIAAASSNSVGGLSGFIPSVLAQAWSVGQVTGITNELLSSVLYRIVRLGDFAVCSQWPNPCTFNDGYFVDGGYTDGASLALHVGHYQSLYNTTDDIPAMKIIQTVNNFETDSSVKFLYYFSTDFNQNVTPGGFQYGPPTIAGTAAQQTPWQSPQIFAEYLDEMTLQEQLQPITDVTTDVSYTQWTVTTIDNPSFGIRAGQEIELLLFLMKSEIPTNIVGPDLTNQFTKPLSSLGQQVAKSQQIQSIVSNFAAATT